MLDIAALDVGEKVVNVGDRTNPYTVLWTGAYGGEPQLLARREDGDFPAVLVSASTLNLDDWEKLEPPLIDPADIYTFDKRVRAPLFLAQVGRKDLPDPNKVQVRITSYEVVE